MAGDSAARVSPGISHSTRCHAAEGGSRRRRKRLRRRAAVLQELQAPAPQSGRCRAARPGLRVPHCRIPVPRRRESPAATRAGPRAGRRAVRSEAGVRLPLRALLRAALRPPYADRNENHENYMDGAGSGAVGEDAPTPRAVRAGLHPHGHPESQVRSPPRSASRGVQSPLDSCGPGWMLSAPSSTCARSRAAAISVRGDGLACTRGHASGGCTAPLSSVSHSFLFCISPGPDCCCCLTRCVALLAEFYGAAGPRARPCWPTRVAGRISGHGAPLRAG